MGLSRSLSKIGSLLSAAGLLTSAAFANGGAELSAHNPILNGDMRINQREIGTFSHNGVISGFPVDRVRVDAYATNWGTCTGGTSAQVALAAPLVTAGATFDYALRITPHSSWAHTYVYQNVEDCRTFNGQTVTVSFYARAASSWNIPCTGRITQACDNGGTGDVENLDNTLIGKTIGTSWSRFTYTVTLGSTGGKPLGANNVLGVNIIQGVDMTTGAPAWIEFTGFKMEIGSVATPFVQRNITTERLACQRYVWKPNMQTLAFSNGGGFLMAQFKFPVTMRAVPSATPVATSLYWESTIWSTVGSLTSATVNNGHLGTDGGELRISGTYSPVPSNGNVYLFGSNQIIFAADL